MPAAQNLQVVKSGSTVYLPAGQSEQIVAPASAYLPETVHAVHELLPVFVAKYPLTHGVQELTVEPVEAE